MAHMISTRLMPCELSTYNQDKDSNSSRKRQAGKETSKQGRKKMLCFHPKFSSQKKEFSCNVCPKPENTFTSFVRFFFDRLWEDMCEMIPRTLEEGTRALTPLFEIFKQNKINQQLGNTTCHFNLRSLGKMPHPFISSP